MTVLGCWLRWHKHLVGQVLWHIVIEKIPKYVANKDSKPWGDIIRSFILSTIIRDRVNFHRNHIFIRKRTRILVNRNVAGISMSTFDCAFSLFFSLKFPGMKMDGRGSMSGPTVLGTVLKTTEYLSLISNVGYATWYLCKITGAYNEVWRTLFPVIVEKIQMIYRQMHLLFV